MISTESTGGATPVINYTPNAIDEYIVVVNLPEDWETVHNYIINENEIDGIPNRKIDCSNAQEFSLRTAIYEMSAAEADILKTHEKVECVELNPDKYPQPVDNDANRFNKLVAFNKPILPANILNNASTVHTNGVRSNWSMLNVGDPSSEPYQGEGINIVDTVDRDLEYVVTGSNVDAVIIDSGVSVLHPEFLKSDGTTRVRDVILDGPMLVDPAAFSGHTGSVTIDGVSIGTRADEARARSWWSTTSIRSSTFQSLGTASISSSYTRIHAHSKNGTNAMTSSHGTSCASQIGGKSFGLAFECNLWGIRISFGDGFISASTALNVCTIFHNAKKALSSDPDPTLINNSYGVSNETANNSGTTYYHTYRGSNTTYTGNGSNINPPSGSGGLRNHKYFTYYSGTSPTYTAYADPGQYMHPASTTSSAAENAIAAGCIVAASAGNRNMKISDKDDVDFNNKYYAHHSGWGGFDYTNQVGGVQKGFSGDHEQGKGTIRVGAMDCAVEPSDEKQGATAYSMRKVCYSSNGPMVDIFAPGEMTMAAGYASGENYARSDDSNYYDRWFNGTSAATPNACSVLALYLGVNRSADQSAARAWLTGTACKTNLLSDPYPGVNDTGYWSLDYNSSTDAASLNRSYNFRGNGNLRGAPNRVLFNPYESGTATEYTLTGPLNVTGSLNITT